MCSSGVVVNYNTDLIASPFWEENRASLAFRIKTIGYGWMNPASRASDRAWNPPRGAFLREAGTPLGFSER
jgi:hypothetical protein